MLGFNISRLKITKKIVPEESTEVDFSSQQKESALFDSLASWTIIIGAFLLPIFFLSSLESPIELGKTVFLSVIIIITLLLWLFARLKGGLFVIPRSMILFATSALVLIFLFAALFSPVSNVSFGGFIYEQGTFVSMLFLFLLMFLASILFQKQRHILYLFGALLLSFVIVFLFHFSRLLFGVDFFSFGIFSSNVSSIVGKWNDVAIFSGMATLLSFIALEFAPTLQIRIKTILYIVLTFSLILLVVVNFFLMWFILGAIALITLVYKLSLSQFLRKDGGETRNLSLTSIIVLVISVLFLVAGSSIGPTIAEYANISNIEVRPSWGSTISITGSTWNEDFFLGSGPNRFVNQWLLNKPEGINTTLFWNTDFKSGIGLIPTFAVTTGALGTLLWVVFFSFFLYAGLRSLFISSGPMLRYLSLSSFIVALYLWIVAIFYVPSIVFFGFSFLMTGVFIAVLVLQNAHKNFVFSITRDPRVGFVSVLVLIVLLVFGFLGSYTLFQQYLSLGYLRDGKIAFNNDGDLDRAERLIEKAISVNKSDNLYRLLTDIEIARLNVVLASQNVSIESIRAEFQEILGKAIAAGQEAVKANGTNYANWLSQGKVYATVVPLNIPGAYENARTSLERAAEFNPQGPAIALEQARLEVARGNLDEARTFINQSLEMKNNYTDAIFLLARIEISEGNVLAAISSLERASLINPNDIGLFFQLGLLKYSREDYEGAIPAFARAVDLSPDYSNAKYFLGISYYNVGRSEDATRQFEGIERLNPDNAEVKKILENLRNGNAPFTGIIPPAEPIEDREQAPINE